MSSTHPPVPAARRTGGDRTSSGTPSTGLLINVIRTLTSSVSEDQRELEKAKLEKGFKESEKLIDRLVKERHNDVEHCLVSFREVSTGITTCREKVNNVRNALQTCHSLLECRRDDLKKLWLENSQQKYVCEILNQLEELKEAPSKVDLAMASGQYQEAARLISVSGELLNGKLSVIEGLSQLRKSILESAQALAKNIIREISVMIVVDPFEKYMFDIVLSLSPQRVQESEQCQKLYEKAISKTEKQSLSSRLAFSVAALSELEGDSNVLEQVLHLSSLEIRKQVAASVNLVRTKSAIDSGDRSLEGDQTHLTQLIQMIVQQINECKQAYSVLAEIVATSNNQNEGKKDPSQSNKLSNVPDNASHVMSSFWESAQSAVESLVSDHLDITPLVSKNPLESKKRLFRFDATAYAGTSTVNSSTAPNALVVCQPSAYNIVPMFPWLRGLMESIEKSTGKQPCPLRIFTHNFITDMFVERVKANLADKLELALRASENPTGRNQNVLPSCEKVLDLCREVHSLIVHMDLYAERFVAIWLLLLSEYNANVNKMYEGTTLSLAEIEGSVCRRKISAAWAADEDISRLLMSLPNWQMAAIDMTAGTPTSPMIESEQEIRQRNERESDILIGNLATQKKMEKIELVTDMNDVRALAALHESLRWFAVEVRKLVASLPKQIEKNLRGCLVHLRQKDGQQLENEPVLKVMEEFVRQLESISDTCLLMLHLELRVHCFFHLLPIARPRNSSVHEEIDQEVVDLGRDLQTFHQLLSGILSQPKLRYIFDGLGHLCAAIFIHTSQHMPRLSEAGKKRICRDVWGVQQRLSQITGRREAALDRARAFFELLSHEPERLIALLPDKRSQFSPMEMNHLISLSVRSHPVLANQPGALEQKLNQLTVILKQST
ncbi:unnamed protein product [Auanema sp. JU1783]|nr:unnamed protein product [Auanema sp. JU1783]